MCEAEAKPDGHPTGRRNIETSARNDQRPDYAQLLAEAVPGRAHWQESCVHSECTLHQLSPYIGKLKSTIARDLVSKYSCAGELVLDPFAGSGTIPLEAVLCNRHVLAADVSPYARVLCQAKLHAPASLDAALASAEATLAKAEHQPVPDLRKVPKWVRSFFHAETLRETIRFAQVCRESSRPFLMGCLLGILHHQRPGFLSYPSSHLVPYLRDKKYPRDEFPGLYEYRELRPRLVAKIRRAYKRDGRSNTVPKSTVKQCAVEELELEGEIDSVITSPPYMNALDYSRDNRLRLWFLDPIGELATEDQATRSRNGFEQSISCLATIAEKHLKEGKYCVVVIGELVTRGRAASPSEIAYAVFGHGAPSLRLQAVIRDSIPDIRRARRSCSATKAEHTLVFRKT